MGSKRETLEKQNIMGDLDLESIPWSWMILSLW